MLFTCHLNVPPTVYENGMPMAWVPMPWLHDTALEDEGGYINFVLELLAFPHAGTFILDSAANAVRHENEAEVRHLIPALLDAGYLRPVHKDGDEEHYELVHPARLGPFPLQESK